MGRRWTIFSLSRVGFATLVVVLETRPYLEYSEDFEELISMCPRAE